MAHIMSHLEMQNEEKLKLLARRLELPLVYAFAHVQWLWMSVMGKSENRFDGNMRGWTPELIADFAAYPGDPEKFVKAMLECGRPFGKEGFIEDRDGVLYLHNWKKWQGPGLLNKQEYERNKRIEAAQEREARESAKYSAAIKGDDTVVKELLDAMRTAHVTGPVNIKREHIEAWRERKITEKAHNYILGEGRGLSIFEISKAMNGSGAAKAAGEDAASAIRKKFLGEGDSK